MGLLRTKDLKCILWTHCVQLVGYMCYCLLHLEALAYTLQIQSISTTNMVQWMIQRNGAGSSICTTNGNPGIVSEQS